MAFLLNGDNCSIYIIDGDDYDYQYHCYSDNIYHDLDDDDDGDDDDDNDDDDDDLIVSRLSESGSNGTGSLPLSPSDLNFPAASNKCSQFICIFNVFFFFFIQYFTL